jgi:hypothetical protein
MNQQLMNPMVLALVLGATGACVSAGFGQNNSSRATASATADSQATARQAVLQSDEWRRMQRDLDQWLFVQQIYTPAEITKMKAEFSSRIGHMSAAELRDFMKDIQQRLKVLNSPEAAEARAWLAQRLAVLRDPDTERRRLRPDVANMTAGEIRQELQQFEQRQAAMQQSQAAFGRTRQFQMQNARDLQASRRQAMEQRQSRPAATHREFRSPYAPLPNRTDVPANQPPLFDVSPWGAPIRWHPFADEWYW